MLGIEKLLEKLIQRQKTPKSEREEFDLDIKTKYVHGLLFYNTYFDHLSKALGKNTVCLIVGGWIRDRLLNRPVKKSVDVDFIVTTDPFNIVKKFREILGRGDIFSFEKEKDVATIIFYEGETRYRFDFSYLDVSDIMENPQLDFYDKEKAIIDRIEQDLLQRDFTINAMAVVFDDALGMGASQTVLFDPSNGLEDLQSGLIRPVSLKNIQEDPVRILRGYRIAQQLDFDIDKEFQKWVKENSHLIKNSPKERLRDEILKIFENEDSFQTIEKLIKTGVFQNIVPEIEDMAQIGRTGNYHKFPLLQHSVKTVYYMEEFLKKKEFIKSSIDKSFLENLGKRKFFSDFSDISLLKLTAFFHDIGKIKTAENNFKEHEKKGATLFKYSISKNLSFSKKATEFVSHLIEHHLDVIRLYLLRKEGSLTEENLNFFWYENKNFAPHLFILTFADVMGTSEDEQFLDEIKLFVIYLQEYYFDVYSKEIVEEPLLTGKEIMEILNLQPSPEVGKIKDMLLKAQIEGKIKTRQQAVDFVKSITL